ncbi:uncharacterized protein VTP21DRAFT_8321 [Calcarisporiella thermophila]|uniref:uncharacterized protein n=1 Tax=Calcarisporiella thermophila TaxID=911321 RepID=UPI003742860B
MHLDKPTIQDLEQWLKTELEPISDADPAVLSEYVISILKHFDPDHDFEQECKNQLQEFLESHTESFVKRFIGLLSQKALIKSKSHGNNASKPDHSGHHHEIEHHGDASHHSRRGDSDLSDEEESDRNFKHRRSANSEAREEGGGDIESGETSSASRGEGARKRRQDSTEAEGRGGKMARFGGPGGPGRFLAGGFPQGPSAGFMPGMMGGGGGAFPQGMGGPGQWNRMPMGRMGFDAQRLGNRMHGRIGDQVTRKKPCFDLRYKGYCTRGSNCPYDHGEGMLPTDGMPGIPMNPMMPMGLPMPGFGQVLIPQQSFPPDGSAGGMGEEGYDPEHAMMGRQPGRMNGPEGAQGGLMEDGSMGRRAPHGTGFTPGRGSGSAGGRFGGPFGSSISVENIPEEHCNTDSVHSFFQTFGTIRNVQIDSRSRRAIVRFETAEQARAAYASPEPIFGNRFVKVYRRKVEQDLLEQAKGPNGTGGAGGDRGAGANASDSAEQAKLRAEQEAAREEAAKKRQENLKKMLELQKRKEELLQRQIDAQKQLMAKLSTIDPKERVELMKEINKVSETISSLTGSSPAATSSTGGDKAAAEGRTDRAAAASSSQANGSEVGTDSAGAGLREANPSSDAASKDGSAVAPVPHAAPYATRGRGSPFRGRGRGFGRGGGAWGGRPTYSLDLRPTKLLVQKLPAEATEEEQLRKLFAQFGQINSLLVDTEARNAMVHFKVRHEAEAAMAGASKLPELAGVEVRWYQDTKPVNTAAKPGSETVSIEPTTVDHEERFDDEAEENDERSWKR